MLGVARGLKRHFNIDWRRVKVHSISSGASGAIALLLCSPREIDRIAHQSIEITHSTDPSDKEDYYLTILHSLVPANAIRRLGNRLTIGVTEFPSFQPLLLNSPFRNTQELIEAIYDSCRIPFFTGSFGKRIDGGFSHNYAVSDENTVIITLKNRRRSDIHLNASNFIELKRPSKEQMHQLYLDGQKLVEDNLDLLAEKIMRGVADKSNTVAFRPARY